jgi:prevent-host-death family protein
MCYISAMRVASRELRNDTAGVLRRAAAGESLEITINGEAVAELGPLRAHRSHWSPKADVVDLLLHAQADPALRDELRQLAGDTTELGPIE